MAAVAGLAVEVAEALATVAEGVEVVARAAVRAVSMAVDLTAGAVQAEAARVEAAKADAPPLPLPPPTPPPHSSLTAASRSRRLPCRYTDGTAGAAGYQALSGQWYYSSPQFGTDTTPWLIQVSPNGQFQGTQQTPKGPLRMQGQFNGMMANAVYSEPPKRPGTPSSSNIVLQFDGQCHVQVAFVDQRGRPINQATFHVNHKASEPCPY